MVAAPRLKALPKEHERTFIDTLRKIRQGIIASPGDIPVLPSHLKEKAEALLSAMTKFGETRFWSVYDTLTPDYASLKEWKETVSTNAEPDAKPEEDPRFIPGKSGQRLIKLDSISDIFDAPDAEYLIADTLETASVSMLYGVSGTGKTFTGLHIALSVVHGLPWYSRKTKAGPVLFINTEGRRNLKKRLKAWYIEHKELKPHPNFKIISWPVDLRAYIQELRDTLTEMEVKPVLIVLDNFSMCAGDVDQNKQEQVAPILRELHNLADTYSSHIMLVHHTNKEDGFNGSMAFRNHVDNMLELRKKDKADKGSPIILSCQKARDDEPFPDIQTELKRVNISFNEETQNFVTSCVTIECEKTVPSVQGLSDVEQDTLNILADRYMGFTEWQNECVKELKISTSTFSRALKVLVSKNHVAKGVVEGKRFEVYHEVVNE